MPETFTPIQWRNNQAPAINETNLNRVEQGLQSVDFRAARLENGVVDPIVLAYATSVTINATQGSLFRCVASGDLTLDDIVGGIDGQTIVFEVQASGAQRALHFTGSTDSIDIAIGQWWVGQFRFVAADNVWLLDDGSGGGGSAGSSNALNILAPQNLPYAATIAPNAATGALFRITAVGDFTLANPINGTDGQAVIVEVLASGAQRTVTFSGGQTTPVAIPSGTRWTATLRYDADDALWVLAQRSDSAGGSGSAVASVNGQTGVVVLDADDLADGSAKILMTPAERTKLTGIATGATANSTDAQLRNRATHTGTQPVSSLTTTGTKSASTFLRGDDSWAPATGTAVTIDGAPAATLDIDSTPITGADLGLDPAAEHGFLAWTYDIAASSGATAPTAGSVYLCRLRVPATASVTALAMSVSASGVGLSNTFVGLFNAAGGRVGVSADQSTAFQSTGVKIVSLDAPAAVTAGRYYVGILVGAGTTIPTFLRGISSASVNVNLAAPNFRYCTSGTGLTAMPTSIDLAASTAASTALWAAVRV